jgi:uncharacterized phage protein gp47/JayE
MAIEFKTPDQVADEYLLNLKSLKPEVNTDQQDSDWWIRSRVVGGVASGIYQDQRKISDDAFPQSARREAIERHLITYFNTGFRAATQSQGDVKVDGTSGSTVAAGTEFIHEPTNNAYQATETVILDAATGLVPVQSVSTGQAQNLLEGTTLKLSAPPVGINNSAVVFGGNIGDGRNEESNEEGAQRVLDRIRQPARGGTEFDYKLWATEASASVSSVSVRRYIQGLGTVGVYFTAGTTDIDQAIDNDQAIVRIPSDELVEEVALYIDALNPLTDCLHVLKPSEIAQDVEVHVTYKNGLNGNTILTGQTLTLNELVQREVKRVLYKLPIGGRVIGASGYILASEIEENIDLKLSASPLCRG